MLAAHAQLGFGCNISRTQHQLDFCPTVTSVTRYARLLQAEMETLALLSGADVEIEPGGEETKRQRAAALKKAEAAAKAVSKGSGNDATPSPGDTSLPQGSTQGSGSNPTPNSNQGKGGQGSGKSGSGSSGNSGGKGSCRFYAAKGGCKMGRNCWSMHDFGKASSEGRCFSCGSTEHRQDACTRPQGRKSGQKDEDAPRGESAAPGSNGAFSSGSSGNSGGKGHQGKQDGKNPQVRQANAESGSGNAQMDAGASDGAKVAKAEGSSQELLAEATKLLKGFRIAAIKVLEGSSGSEDGEEEIHHLTKVAQDPPKHARGLLDGGATNALRTARDAKELECCTITEVSLALGQTQLHLTPVGTLLSASPVAPVVPMGVLAAELQCRVSWEGETCTVVHPTRGKLPVVMANRCPELCADLTEALIREIEDKRAQVLRRALQLKAWSMTEERERKRDLGMETHLNLRCLLGCAS